MKNNENKVEMSNHDYPWRNTGTVVTTMILALIIGISLAFPFKIIETVRKASLDEAVAEGQSEAGATFVYAPRQELISRILMLTSEKDSLKDALMKEREQLGNLETSIGQIELETQQLLESNRAASILAGLREITGPGIILRLEESADSPPAGEDMTPYIIHQEDLLNITNELWAAGAEGMAIRSSDRIERIVVTTAIRCVGPVVHVNNQPMAPPFEILVIGNPKTLRQSLEGPGRVLQPLQFFNIEYTIEEKEEITLPPYSGAVRADYIKQAEDALKGKQNL